MRQDSKANNIIRDIVILTDFIVLNILFCLWFQYDRQGAQLSHSVSVFRPLFVANIGMVVSQYFYSTVIHEHRSTAEQVLRQITYLVLLQGATTLVASEVVAYLTGMASPAFSFTAYFTLMLYAGILVTRYAERWFVKRYRRTGGNIRRVVFVGADLSILPIYEFLVGDPSTGYRVSGYYADAPMQDCPQGLRHRGTLADLDVKLELRDGEHAADELYCCLPVTDTDRIRRIMRYCDNNVVHFYYIPAISRNFGHMLKPENVGGMTVFTNCDDPRKFAFGNFMRKANIDELPQFFNVLRGDMSIVGPRPHMLYHTEVYRPLIDKYMVRHFVKPGITGWAQVTGFRGETRELWQMEGRVKRDIWYIENWSVWLDIRIILRTAIQVFVHDKNAY